MSKKTFKLLNFLLNKLQLRTIRADGGILLYRRSFILLCGRLDAVEMGFGAEEKGFARDCRGSHEAVGEGVRRQDFQRAAGFEDPRCAFLIAEIELAIGKDWGSCVLAAD